MRAKTGFLLLLFVLAALVLAVLLARIMREPAVAPVPAVVDIELGTGADTDADAPAFDPGDDRASMVEREALPAQSPEGLYRDLDEAFKRIPLADGSGQDDDIPLETDLPALPDPVPDEEEEEGGDDDGDGTPP